MENILTIVLVLGGLFGLGACLRALARNRSSFKWPTTKGKIISSMVKSVGHGEDVRQRTEIIYEYTLGGKTLQSGRVSYADDYSDAQLTDAKLTETVRRYPVGEEVTVYFDPNDPKESVLEPKLNSTIYVAMAVCGLVVAGALWWRIAAFGRPQLTRDQVSHPLGGNASDSPAATSGSSSN